MRITYVCEKCGSKLVTRDAWAEWDEDAQRWALGAAYDYTFCHACETGTDLREEALDGQPEAQ